MKSKFILLPLVFIALFSSGQNEKISPSEIKRPAYFDVSRPLSEMTIPAQVRDRSWKDGVVKNKFDMPQYKNVRAGEPTAEDYKGLQTKQGERQSELLLSIDGVGNISGVLPPDTQGDVGINHYMQMVNLAFAIYDKAGNLVYGPVDNQTLWNGFPGPWTGSNDGDPVVVYDELADRWVASQFALPNYPNGPFYEMIAVSQTNDPTGAWYRYAYEFTHMPDYPKLGVWGDAYYLSVNSFASGTLNWAGTGVAALERNKMLVGDPTASMIFFTTPSSGDPSSFLPADCDGDMAPANTPGLFAYVRDATTDRLVLYELNINWNNPSASTFSLLVTLPVMPFNSNVPQIPQPGTNRTLNTLADRLMYRLQYRNFGTYQAMVTNHTVNISGRAGVRWYELRNTGDGWFIYQQATYSPDVTPRWMGSIAMNANGDIALGYSVSNTDLFPSIRYTGRRADDPLGQMTITEQEIVQGGGSQTHAAERWGDYSMMSVDPVNDDIFWYTQEYYQSGGSANWKTRIASFTFASPVVAMASAEPDTICQGESVQLSVETSGGVAPLTYEWTSVPEEFYSTEPNPVAQPVEPTVYTVVVTDGVTSAQSSVNVHVLNSVQINWAPQETQCINDMWMNALVINYDNIQWTTSGDGVFENANAPQTFYYPGPEDISNINVQITITATNNTGCPEAVQTETFYLIAPAIVDAGEDVYSCEGAPVLLVGNVENGSPEWYSTGDGVFSDYLDAQVVYTPGPMDILADSVIIILSVQGSDPCGLVNDTVFVFMEQTPTVYAGDDAIYCSTQTINLQGEATNYNAVVWTSTGDGVFNSPTSLITTYSPGVNDILLQEVDLMLTASNQTCNPIVDTLHIQLQSLPVISAGNDTLVCEYSVVELNGIASGTSSLLWSTSGNGTFDNAQALQTIYYPGIADTMTGSVVLTLSATSAVCPVVQDDLVVTFSECVNANSPSWNPGIAVVPNPAKGLFTVSLSTVGSGNLTFRITDNQGKLIVTRHYKDVSSVFETTFDLSNYPRGMYFLNVDNGTDQTTIKVIMQ